MKQKRYGIQALNEQPDSRKVRRVFSFSDTIAEDKNILREKLQKEFGEFEPVEINVPSYIKNVDSYFNRWDQTIFYNVIRQFQNDHVTLKSLDNDNEEGQIIRRDDFIPYSGDVDTFIPCLGNMLFIDEKESINAIKENQTSIYISLSKASNQTVWYLVGPTPNRKDPRHKDIEYKLCEIQPNGEFQWYKGSFVDVMRYLSHWLEKSYDEPMENELQNIRTAKRLMKAAETEDTYHTLSNRVAYLDQHSRYKAA